MRLFMSCLCGGFAAYWLALGVNLPSWRSGPVGDASDIGWSVAVAIFFFGWRLKKDDQ